ncbi:MAG: hypothetical protein Q4D21_09235 [Phascolarctobacterium sp.]|nr:hypothetical protein [Phascolarctobacterium sp.]
MKYFNKLRWVSKNESLVIDPECRRIIHNAALEAAVVGAGLAQVPAADHIIISALQVNMVKDLAKAQGRTISEGAIKGLMVSFAATYVGRGTSKFLLGWIPIFGNVINATTAATITEAFGWAVLRTMQKNDFDLQSA